MKQFLRYQISGSVFIIWALVFYYGSDISDLESLIKRFLQYDLKGILLLAVFFAMPSGVMIHQLSVLIKNWLLGQIWKEFKDFPSETYLKKLNYNEKITTYIFDRISNLNSFYYVRVDNGLISPALAFIVVALIMDKNIKDVWLCFAIIICLITIVYIFSIYSELKKYNEILKSLKPTFNSLSYKRFQLINKP